MKTCFSMEVVDLNNQAPNRNKRESKYFWDELYGLVSAGGFEYIEVPYEAKWDFGGRSGIPRSLRSLNIKFGSVAGYMEHLAGSGIKGISCVHMDPTLFCSGMIEMYFGAFGHFAEEAITLAKEAGAEVVTLTVTPPRFAVTNILKTVEAEDKEGFFIERTAQLIDALALKAAEAGVKLCVKNEYWGLLAGEKIVDFVANLKNEVYLDVDTANLKIAGVDVEGFIKANKDKIGIVHFTDTAYMAKPEDIKGVMPEFPASGATKVFRDIGDGEVDFVSIINALGEVGYDGTIVYNCRNSYDICRSILRTRRYINKCKEV